MVVVVAGEPGTTGAGGRAYSSSRTTSGWGDLRQSRGLGGRLCTGTRPCGLIRSQEICRGACKWLMHDIGDAYNQVITFESEHSPPMAMLCKSISKVFSSCRRRIFST